MFVNSVISLQGSLDPWKRARLGITGEADDKPRYHQFNERRPAAARRQKLQPEGSVPENCATWAGAESRNATATGRCASFTDAPKRCSKSLQFPALIPFSPRFIGQFASITQAAGRFLQPASYNDLWKTRLESVFPRATLKNPRVSGLF